MPEIIEEYHQDIKTLSKNQEQDRLDIQKLQEEVKRLQTEVRFLLGIMD